MATIKTITKKITLAAMCAATAMVMTGCGIPAAITAIEPAPQKSYDSPAVEGKTLYTVGASNYEKGLNPFKDVYSIDAGVMLTLQKAAEETLASGKTHFSIYRPYAASQVDGVGPKNIEQFYEVCIKGDSDNILVEHTRLFYSSMTHCGLRQKRAGYLEMLTHDGKPSDMDAFDARHVIEYLKQNGLYEEHAKEFPLQTIDRVRGNYTGWVDDFRDTKS